MASLKDLRNRIAATKATQKITKAMQMVAASKLRRAQATAEAARPYATQMDKVLGNIAASVAGSESAPRLLRGTGQRPASLTGLHRRARPVRAVQYRHRAACPRARRRADARGQGSQILLRRPQGLRSVAPALCRPDRRDGRFARGADIAVRQRGNDRRKGHRPLQQFRVRRLHAVLLAVPLGDRADPDRAADHSAGVRRYRDRRARRRGLRIRTRSRRHSARPVAAQRRRADFPRASGKLGVVLRRADVGDGQRDPQRRRHDPPADAHLQPHPPGDDHERTDRDHFRRGGACNHSQRGP